MTTSPVDTPVSSVSAGFPLRVRMLGPFSLEYAGESRLRQQSSRRLWSLLEYLIINRKRSAAQADIIDALWPDGSSDNPQGALRALIFRARKLLGELGIDDPAAIIVNDADGYRWVSPAGTVMDTESFELYARIATDRAIPMERRMDAAERALDLYQGDFLADNTDSWTEATRIYLRNRFAVVVCVHSVDLLASGDSQGAVDVCRTGIDMVPLDEDLNAAYVSVLNTIGMPQAGREHLLSFEQRLNDELGERPGTDFISKVNGFEARFMELVRASDSLASFLGSEDTADEPLECDYPLFDNIRLFARRLGHCLVYPGTEGAFSVVPDDASDLTPSDVADYVNRLGECLHDSLGRGGVICRRSATRYVILLFSEDVTQADAAFAAIEAAFAGKTTGDPVSLSVERRNIATS